MGAVYDEFLEELAEVERKCKGRPDLERQRLYSMALEREQLVSVAYSDAILKPRLDSLGVPAEVRALIRQALAWLWRSEEMHAVFIRGTLLGRKAPLRGPSVLAQQALGSVAGWTSSMKQHVGLVDAPFSHSLASMIASSASVVGKLSPTLREELTQRSFHSFCHFNIDAEKTAAHCWERLIDFAESDFERRAFERIAADERHHEHIFTVLAESLDERDQLRSGVTYESLAARIKSAGDQYLPRALRDRYKGPIGSGAPVSAFEGESLADKQSTLEETLSDAGLATLVRAAADKAGEGEAVVVAVKASFSLGYHRDDMSMVIDPEVLEGLARFLRRHGATDVVVLEAPSLYDHYFENRGVREVAEYFGYTSTLYRVVDSSTDQVEHAFARGLGNFSLSATWRDADLRISAAKLRSHCSERIYGSLANLQGITGRLEDFLFFDKLAHWPAATVALADAFPPDFAVVDAYESASDGLFGIMACRHPRQPLRFYAGTDALAVDCIVGRDTGMLDPMQSNILRTAADWFGASLEAIPTRGVSTPIRPWFDPYRNEASAMLAMISYPVYVFGSGRGSFFVPEMDTEAFPPKGRPSPVLKGLRKVGTRALGLHPAR